MIIVDCIRDRGIIKWQSAMLLPEHVQKLNDFYQEIFKLQKPTLDEEKLSKMDVLMREAIEFNTPLHFTVFEDDELLELIGYVQFVDIISGEYRIKDFKHENHYLEIRKIIEIIRVSGGN